MSIWKALAYLVAGGCGLAAFLGADVNAIKALGLGVIALVVAGIVP